MEQTTNPFRVGILGGMGPLAGVLLQKLIIEATPATRDQEHLEVVCFTNPHIPDRTESLKHNNGALYIKSLVASAGILHNTGVKVIAIPCNTAHAKLHELRKHISIPILDMISLTIDFIARKYGRQSRIGLMATDGTISEAMYEQIGRQYGFSFVLPHDADQKLLMDTIYNIKAGKRSGIRQVIMNIASTLASEGAEVVIFGCTELSLYTQTKTKGAPAVPIVDPLRVLAHKLVVLSQ